MGSWDHEAGGRLDPASAGLHHHEAHGDSWRERVHDPTASSGRPARRPAPLGSLGDDLGRAPTRHAASDSTPCRPYFAYFASSRRIVATADVVSSLRSSPCPSSLLGGGFRLGGEGATVGGMARGISAKAVEDVARELMARAAIDIPADYREGVVRARDGERNRIARFVLDEMLRNWEIATAERRPMCADTGLPRYYVRVGNEASVEGGFVALERALRRGDGGCDRGDSTSAESGASAHAQGSRQQRRRARARGDVGVRARAPTGSTSPPCTRAGCSAATTACCFRPTAWAASSASSSTRWSSTASGAWPASRPSWASASAARRTRACGWARRPRACARSAAATPIRTIARLEEELTALGNYIGIGAMGFAGHVAGGGHPHRDRLHPHRRPAGRHPPVLPVLAPRHRAPAPGRARRVPQRPGLVHRLLPSRGHRVSAPIERLDDVRMDEVVLTTPVSDADLARLKLGDVVYLDGVRLHRARGRLPQGRRRGTRAAGLGARAHQRQLPLLARGQRAARRHATRWRR